MAQNIIFLRHADTQKDPNVHASQWGLSPAGMEQAERIADIEALQAVDVIYVSEEPKTSLTVEPLARKLGKTAESRAVFNEVARGEKFLSKEEFEIEKNKQLEDLDYPAFNGETGNAALARFRDGVAAVMAEHPTEAILIVTHGTVLNIYFADLLRAQEELTQRWSKTGFGAYGIVADGVVVRDITESV